MDEEIEAIERTFEAVKKPLRHPKKNLKAVSVRPILPDDKVRVYAELRVAG